MLELKSNATEEPLQDFRLFAKGSALRRNPGRHLKDPSEPKLLTVSLFIVQEVGGSRMRKGTQAKV
jgi:hypothetical protein